MASGRSYVYRVNEYRSRGDVDIDVRVTSNKIREFATYNSRFRVCDTKKDVFKVRDKVTELKDVMGRNYRRGDRDREAGEVSSESDGGGEHVAKKRKVSSVESVHTPSIESKRPNIVPGLNGCVLDESKLMLDGYRLGVGEEEPGQVEDGEFVPAPKKAGSRWVDDEDEEEDVVMREDVSMKRKSGSSSSREHELVVVGKGSTERACSRSRSLDVYKSGSRSSSVSECEDNKNEVEDSNQVEVGKVVCSPGNTEPVVQPKRGSTGCRSVYDFERLNKIDEGTYGVVFKAKDKSSGEIVALKKVKMEKEREGFPVTALREINILLSLNHPSVIDTKEIVMGPDLNDVFMVMDYMEHDLKALMETKPQPFSQSEVKCLMLQLLEGVNYLHENWVIHRDLKTSNILMNNRGELKICDFGLSRQYGSPLKPYTQLVVTLWYRAPELLLGAKQYSTAIDMWSLGCIMAELLTKEPLFCGKTDIDQLDKIFRTLGTPTEDIWPGVTKLPASKGKFAKHYYDQMRKKFRAVSFIGTPIISESGYDLLRKLLNYDPEKRITAKDALNHEWFREVPLPTSKDFMPTFPDLHAKARRERRVLKSPDPLEEQRRKERQQGEIGTGGLFS